MTSFDAFGRQENLDPCVPEKIDEKRRNSRDIPRFDFFRNLSYEFYIDWVMHRNWGYVVLGFKGSSSLSPSDRLPVRF